VLAAVINLTTSYSQLTAETTLRTLAEFAALDRSEFSKPTRDRNYAHTRKALSALARLGIVTYTPAGGRPGKDAAGHSVVGLPTLETHATDGRGSTAETQATNRRGLASSSNDHGSETLADPSSETLADPSLARDNSNLRGEPNEIPPLTTSKSATHDRQQLVGLAVDRYRNAGGRIYSNDPKKKGALASAVNAATGKDGKPVDLVLTAIAELGRSDTFPSVTALRETIAVLEEKGGVCTYGGDRRQLTAEQLAECGCKGCAKRAEKLRLHHDDPAELVPAA
jgi:hypothetical protein